MYLTPSEAGQRPTGQQGRSPPAEYQLTAHCLQKEWPHGSATGCVSFVLFPPSGSDFARARASLNTSWQMSQVTTAVGGCTQTRVPHSGTGPCTMTACNWSAITAWIVSLTHWALSPCLRNEVRQSEIFFISSNADVTRARRRARLAASETTCIYRSSEHDRSFVRRTENIEKRRRH